MDALTQTNYFLGYSVSDALLKLNHKHLKKSLTMRKMLLNFACKIKAKSCNTCQAADNISTAI